MGIGLGGASGAILGSQFGRGHGTAAAAVGVGILGAIAGSLVEKKLNTQEAIEYVIKLTNNQLMTVVQGLDVIYSAGQKVIVMVSYDGRSRLVADNSLVQDVQAPIQAPTVRVNKKR
jgi:outer membrane lipoprotein SlyB